MIEDQVAIIICGFKKSFETFPVNKSEKNLRRFLGIHNNKHRATLDALKAGEKLTDKRM
jgi:F-type H+-transporting ATPase subunit alpha